MSALEDFLARCEALTGYRARRSGAGFLARCPAHEDRRPCLSVREGDRGKVLAYCFAGCTFAEILAALNLESGAEIPPRRPLLRLPEQQPDPLPSEEALDGWRVALLTSHAMERLDALRGWNLDAIVACELGLDGNRIVFPIRNEWLELVNVVRYQPNPARRFGPKLRALRGRPRNLFPPPEIVPDDDVLVLVEGEPDAVTAIALGLRAVGVPGVGTWKPEWTRRLAGRRIALLFDADRRGRPFALRAKRELTGHVSRLTTVDLESIEPGAKDITDALLVRRARGEP